MGDIDLRQILVGFLAITASLTFHEFAHAYTADRLGDPTPRNAGRLTLNPVVIMKAHPFGALLVPLFGAYTGFLVGWAATPVNPTRARKVPLRTAEFLIAVAGPLSNLLLLGVFIGVYVALFRFRLEGWAEPLLAFAFMMVVTNVILAVLNIMPVPPLDGFVVLEAKAPASWAGAINFIKQYGLIIFLMLFFYFGRIIDPVLRWVLGFLNSMAAATL